MAQNTILGEMKWSKIRYWAKEVAQNSNFGETFYFRLAVSPSPSLDDRSGHLAIPKHLEDVDVDPVGQAHLDIHFSLVDGRWNHPFGECPAAMKYFEAHLHWRLLYDDNVCIFIAATFVRGDIASVN